MKINKIDIKNYRCFENIEITLNSNLNVIVGINASGKTSVLDALAIAAGTFLVGFDGVSKISIDKEDVLHKCFDMGSVLDLQPQYPAEIMAEGTINNKSVCWKRTLDGDKGRTKIIESREIVTISKEFQQSIREGNKSIILPLLAYYGTGRLWAQKKNKKVNEDISKFSRVSGYIDCLSAISNEKMMLKWFQKMIVQEASGKILPELQAVKYAVKKCFESASGFLPHDIKFNLDTHELDVLYADKENNQQRIPINQLSDGYKNTLGMVADIAYRMAVLNPQLLSDVLEKTPGIVLIDEIDQHLHPRWQQNIINDLRLVFPNVQFILTTHAPAVINSVKRENLIILENGKALKPTNKTYGRDVNTILREIMNTPQRPVEINERFNEFYKYIKNNELEKASKILNEIIQSIGEDDSEIVDALVTLDLKSMPEVCDDIN